MMFGYALDLEIYRAVTYFQTPCPSEDLITGRIFLCDLFLLPHAALVTAQVESATQPLGGAAVDSTYQNSTMLLTDRLS